MNRQWPSRIGWAPDNPPNLGERKKPKARFADFPVGLRLLGVVGKMSSGDNSHPPVEPDAGAVERQYGDFAALYAEVRSKAAASAGRGSDARQWDQVEQELEGDA